MEVYPAGHMRMQLDLQGPRHACSPPNWLSEMADARACGAVAPGMGKPLAVGVGRGYRQARAPSPRRKKKCELCVCVGGGGGGGEMAKFLPFTKVVCT